MAHGVASRITLSADQSRCPSSPQRGKGGGVLLPTSGFGSGPRSRLDHHGKIGASIGRSNHFDIEGEVVALEEHNGWPDRGPYARSRRMVHSHDGGEGLV